MQELETLGASANTGESSDFFTKSLREIALFVHEVARREAIRGRDYDGLEAELLQLTRAQALALGRVRARPECRAPRRRSAPSAIGCRHVCRRSWTRRAPTWRRGSRPSSGRSSSAISVSRKAPGRLDFSDLLLIARDLLRGNPGVRRDLQTRFTHVFVDEFQDTDPLQAEILLLLAADDPDEVGVDARPPRAGQALPGRRPEAVDLSLPARRRRRSTRR